MSIKEPLSRDRPLSSCRQESQTNAVHSSGIDTHSSHATILD